MTDRSSPSAGHRPDARQRYGETTEGLLDRLRTELQETGACRVATLNVAEIHGIIDVLGLYADECFIDVAGWLYVKKRDGAQRA